LIERAASSDCSVNSRRLTTDEIAAAAGAAAAAADCRRTDFENVNPRSVIGRFPDDTVCLILCQRR